jgi:antirestriction protein
MTNLTAEIRIYVADLAAYNNGKLHGCWIDATSDIDEILEQVDDMMERSPEGFAEEWAIHDYEGFGGVSISEHEGFESVQEKALFIEEHGVLGASVLDHWCGDIDDARQALDDRYCGCHSSVADYAQELTEETGDIPSHLEMYIDYERMGRDMELGGDIYTIETGYQEVHIFWSH